MAPEVGEHGPLGEAAPLSPVRINELPPLRVVHVIESHRCEHCGAVCPSCLRTDEAAPSGSNEQVDQ